MQVLFRVLRCFQRDLSRLENYNIQLTKNEEGVFMSVPGKTIRCDYLAPWLPQKSIKYGIISDKHRIEYINEINDLYQKFLEDDKNLYLECKDGVISAYEVSRNDTVITLLRRIKLVPYNNFLFHWAFSSK